ncbi:dihydrofolate reductase [Halieaceae bacterium IMCC14734]|uniref:Dihydrofolate reductase n=1 Tax=Candidatus Litorirhabdus singularis TaxID=2518993 RepID=A0ABT3TD28_9GAMM|nr:dihydrofolate reductase [Candidatus Litorirhabdus singularis]MCX2980085.1 dihydrofolate reductase [Candidatus Litorirhabdus singularis]
MHLALIAAVADNGVIGSNNALPWHLPEDLRYFKRSTMGKPIVMGRLTYESIGRPLPGRTNIVVSREAGLKIDGVQVAGDLPAALELGKVAAAKAGVDELVVIGGAQIYALALPLAQRLYLTEVHADVSGDVFFPAWDRTQWQELEREPHQAGDANPYDYSFVVYERRS